jgi:hypothetical protein
VEAIKETAKEYKVSIAGQEHHISKSNRTCSCGNPVCPAIPKLSAYLYDKCNPRCPICGAGVSGNQGLWKCHKDISHYWRWRGGVLRQSKAAGDTTDKAAWHPATEYLLAAIRGERDKYSKWVVVNGREIQEYG